MNNEFIAKTEPLDYNFPVFGGNFDTPAIMLAKKDKTIVGSVEYTDLCFTFNLNAFQTVTFKIYRELDGKIQKYFDYFEDGMLIVIPGISWYEIHVETDTDNSVITKTVTGTSLECKLCDKRLFDFQVNSDDFEDDDYARTTFYNPLNTKKSLLNRVLNVTPNWRVGHVDQSLMDMQRTFDESDIDVYSFLTGNVAEAFNCLFVFDTFDCTVNAYDLDNYGNDTKIFVDSENLVTNMTQKIDENSIITCYRVVGGDYVEIAEVNPNGSNKIYNFSYCLSQMPQKIQDKINAYNTKFQSLKPQYEDVVVRMQTQLEIIQELYTRIPDSETSTDWTKYGLELLKNREKSYQNVHDVYCAQGMNNPQSLNYNLYQENLKLLNGVKAEIGVRETEIENAQNVWKSINGEMLDIQGQLDMNKWFSEEEWKTLDDYVIEATYSNDNFSIFDNTSDAELLSVEKELYDAAWKDLSKKCRPKYQYSATLMNLLAMKEFKELAKYFKLGNFIRTKTEFGELIKLRIISFTIDYSKAGLIDVTFSDATKVNIQGVCEDTADILAQAHSAAMSFKFNKDQYDNSVKQGNFVSEMRKNGLDVAITNIHNSSNQSQVWDETGMTFRQWNAQKNDFDPEMIKIINNQMVFSDDGLKTARMALGKIALGNGEYGYGLNAEVLMSKLVMSENLYLENNSGTYKFTDDGFIASNGINSIKIQPNKSDELFSLYKGDDRNFYIDSDGDIWLSGNLSGGSINIGNGSFNVDNSGGFSFASGKFTYDPAKDKMTMRGVTIEWSTSTPPEIADISGLTQQLNGIDAYLNQLDDRIQSFSQTNDPSSDWTTTELKNKHKGDLWFNPNNGLTRRWTGTAWETITDSGLETLAKSKAQIFTTTPTVPYYIGDLWVQGSNGDILNCITTRTSGSYVASDWAKSSKYTDDTAVTNLDDKVAKILAGEYKTTIGDDYIISPHIGGGDININNRFKVDSYGNVTLPDNATISWGQVTGTGNVANISDIPTNNNQLLNGAGYTTMSDVEGKGYQNSAQVTQITKDTVTTSYVNALNVTAGSVAAENITGTTISGKTITASIISGGYVNGAAISGGSFVSEYNQYGNYKKIAIQDGLISITTNQDQRQITLSDTSSLGEVGLSGRSIVVRSSNYNGTGTVDRIRLNGTDGKIILSDEYGNSSDGIKYDQDYGLVFGNSLVPSYDGGFNLGRDARHWGNLYVKNINGTNLYVNNINGTSVSSFAKSGDYNLYGLNSDYPGYMVVTTNVYRIAAQSNGDLAVRTYDGLSFLSGSASDIKLKKDISDSVICAIDTIKKINHKSFTWKRNGKRVNNGYIAQELELIDENMVTINEDESGEDWYSINNLYMIGLCTKAIQEQQKEIDELRQEVMYLKQQINNRLEGDSV